MPDPLYAVNRIVVSWPQSALFELRPPSLSLNLCGCGSHGCQSAPDHDIRRASRGPLFHTRRRPVSYLTKVPIRNGDTLNLSHTSSEERDGHVTDRRARLWYFYDTVIQIA